MSHDTHDLMQPEELMKMLRNRPSTSRKKRLRQSDLASRVGVDTRAIQQWEGGDRLPSAYNLQRLVQVYVEEAVFLPGTERQEAWMLWQSVKLVYDSRPGTYRYYPEFDENWFVQVLADREAGSNHSIILQKGVSTQRPDKQVEPAVGANERSDLKKRPAGNLPIQLSSFVGRGAQLAEIHDLLRQSSLVTLTGPGGSGKTSLALQLASSLADSYPDGIWLFEFAAVSDPQLVVAYMMSTLGLEDRQGRTPMESVLDVIQDRSMLFIFDNCEHLIDACAVVTESLLARSPALVVLATSQEPLNLPGENRYLVQALNTPPEKDLSYSQLMEYESVQLFVERATLLLPHFKVQEPQAVHIADICRKLEGNPLALELAAARMNVLSPEQINERLTDLLGFLTAGKRTATPRQQTLKAAMDWSYSLLSEKEQLLFRLLSVFMGEFTLETVEEVCVYRPKHQEPCSLTKEEILNLFANLVNKSLVSMHSSTSADRVTYALLAPVKQYAQEQLESCQLECHRVHGADKEHIYRLHAQYFARYMEEMEQEVQSGNTTIALGKIRTEYDNLRAALQWAYSQNDPEGTGLRIAGSLCEFWSLEGNWSEGLLWLSRLLPAANNYEDLKALNKAFKGRELLLSAQGSGDVYTA
ncbi:helix-turn-helix domain-containing protein [Paenibacillus sp. GCM10012306]|uniref:helix-turn-helix domain-containing protein n=1 Tax=Paenibacillus sp. GCM10012306 TaxID=3317342 RepID=UPI00361D9791